MKNQIGQLISTLIGAVIISAYFLFESFIFGSIIWFFWYAFGVGDLFNIGTLSIFQIVGVLFIWKILRFDATKTPEEKKTETTE